MSKPVKVWVIHDRTEDLRNIGDGIRKSDPERNLVPTCYKADWVKAGGKFLDVDGADIVVIHLGILDDAAGRSFMNEKMRQVKNWIVVSGCGKYTGKVIQGETGKECAFDETELHWKAFFEEYEYIEDDVNFLATIISQGIVPWRNEYFLEITLRLLALNEENIRVVKKIVGIGEGDELTSGEYERRTVLNEEEKRLFTKVKVGVLKLLGMKDSVKLFYAEGEVISLYDSIYASLHTLCRKGS